MALFPGNIEETDSVGVEASDGVHVEDVEEPKDCSEENPHVTLDSEMVLLRCNLGEGNETVYRLFS